VFVPGFVPVTVTVPAFVTPGVVPTPVFVVGGVYPVGICDTKEDSVDAGFVSKAPSPDKKRGIDAAVYKPAAINVSRISVLAYELALAASRTTCWPTGELAKRNTAVEATAAGAATRSCACAVGSETSPLIVAISLDASADKPVVLSPGKSGVRFAGVMPASAVSNWLEAASASSGVPPAAMTSLNAVNALLFVLAALTVLLKADAALANPETSPV
jgi:hypothetical protein